MLDIYRAGSAPAPFGALRSFSDITLAAGAGSRTHHHREAEVLTLVLAGALTYKDAGDNIETIPAGHIHRLSAGLGLTHAEANLADAPARYLQIEIAPDIYGARPASELRALPPAGAAGSLYLLASGDETAGALLILQDAALYLSELAAGQALERPLDAQRGAAIFVLEGQVELNGVELGAGDQARLTDEPALRLRALTPARLLLLDLPHP